MVCYGISGVVNYRDFRETGPSSSLPGLLGVFCLSFLLSDLKANIVCVYVVSSQASLKEENNRKYQRKKRCKERPSRPLPCLYVKRPQTTRGINHFHLFSNNDLLWDTGNMHAPTPTHCMRYMLPWHLDLTTGAATSQDETHSSFR